METLGEFTILGFFRGDEGVLSWIRLPNTEVRTLPGGGLVSFWGDLFVGFLDFGEVVCDVIFIVDVFLTKFKVTSAALQSNMVYAL